MTVPPPTRPARAARTSAPAFGQDGGALARTWRWLSSLGGVLTLLLLAELLTRFGVLPAQYIPPPSVVLGRLGGLVLQPEFWQATGLTLLGWAIALAIAAVVAIPLGVLLGTSELAYRATRPIVEFLRPVPSVALIPLVFLMFAPGSMDGKVFLAAFAATWPLLIQVIYGVRAINPTQLATARSFQIGRVRSFLRVVLPGSTPYLATGLRIASTVALILTVTGEIIMGAPGIGLEINLARQGADVPLMYAYVIVGGVLGLLLNLIFAALERRVLHWHVSQRGTSR